MAIVDFSFRRPEHKIGEFIRADVFLSTEAVYERDVPIHPVEGGLDLSDHIKVKPPALTVVGVISDAPMDYEDIFTIGDFDERVNDLYVELRSLWANADTSSLVTIVDGQYKYDNMCLTSLTHPRDANTGSSVQFTAVFRAIEFVEKGEVEVEYITNKDNSRQESAGTKNAGNATKGEVEGNNQTIFYQGGDYLSKKLFQVDLSTLFGG